MSNAKQWLSQTETGHFLTWLSRAVSGNFEKWSSRADVGHLKKKKLGLIRGSYVIRSYSRCSIKQGCEII